MRIKRNINAITRAICERATREAKDLSMRMAWLCDQYAPINNYIRARLCINWRLMENVQDIERLLALGPNVIESTAITIRLIVVTSWRG